MNDRAKDIVTTLARQWLALNHGSLGIPAKGKRREVALIEFLRGATMIATATGDEELAQALCAPMMMVSIRDAREIQSFATRALSSEEGETFESNRFRVVISADHQRASTALRVGPYRAPTAHHDCQDFIAKVRGATDATQLDDIVDSFLGEIIAT